MADTPPITLSLTGKLFIQFPGQDLVEVAEVTIPFTASVIAHRPDQPCPSCAVVRVLDGRPMYCERCGQGIKHATPALAEEGRRLAFERDNLIAQGVDPADLEIPLHPGDPT